MKHVLSILFLSLAFALSAQAQTYAVFSVRGDVRMMNNKKSIPLKLRQNVHASDNVIVPATGKLILLDKGNSKLFTINKPYSGTVSNS